ncbi:MAG: SHOCT domain-containing protein [Deinococcales bacterium]|jgi:putative membrane protein
MMGFGYGMGGWGGFGWIGPLLFVVLLVLGIVYLGRALGLGRSEHLAPGSDALPKGEDRAMQILRERYARGEIDAEEFDRRKQDLA